MVYSVDDERRGDFELLLVGDLEALTGDLRDLEDFTGERLTEPRFGLRFRLRTLSFKSIWVRWFFLNMGSESTINAQRPFPYLAMPCFKACTS